MALILLVSALLTIDFFVNLLFCLVVFFVKIWFLKALLRLIFPLPVILNLFLAPDFVFTFGILLSVKLYYFLPFGAINKYILFPSNFGPFRWRGVALRGRCSGYQSRVICIELPFDGALANA